MDLSTLPPLDTIPFYVLQFFRLLHVIVPSCTILALCINGNIHFLKKECQAIPSFESSTDKNVKIVQNLSKHAAAPFIYINSWPGVGKHTIAKALASHLGDKAKVIHNHLHIDLAEALLPRSGASYRQLRQQLREVLFTTLATCSDTFRHTYIFTDFQTSNTVGISTAQAHAHAARRRGCAFIPILLTCAMRENVQRICSQERQALAASGKGVLLDTELLKAMRGRGEIYSFDDGEGIYGMELDVTSLGPEEAAGLIAMHVSAVIGGAVTLKN